MTTSPVTKRRRLFAGLLATVVPGAAVVALVAGPPAGGANDPCSASEVARTAGSVVTSMGDYLDAHPETNQAMTTLLQEQAGPQSLASLKTYFEANPKVATDMAKISQPLTGLSLQCKLPISIPQVMGLMQQTQGGGGQLVGGTTGTRPAATGPVTPVGTNPLPGPARGNTVG